MRARKIICVLLTVLLAAGTAGCALGDPDASDYRRIGLEVTALMSEIADSETYLSMISGQNSLDVIREEVNTGDYDTPTAVYSLDPEEMKAYIRDMMFADEETKKNWDSLSATLQEQVSARISPQLLINYVNSQAGADRIAFTSLASVILKNEELTGESQTCYLYLFEKGTPILVSFGYHSASGLFVFLPEEARTSPEALSAALFGLKVTPAE